MVGPTGSYWQRCKLRYTAIRMWNLRRERWKPFEQNVPRHKDEVKNSCANSRLVEPWGDMAIQDFDRTKELYHCFAKGQRALLTTGPTRFFYRALWSLTVHREIQPRSLSTWWIRSGGGGSDHTSWWYWYPIYDETLPRSTSQNALNLFQPCFRTNASSKE